MKPLYLRIIVGLVIVLSVAGATAAVVHHNSVDKHNSSMQEADAMKKADEAKAMKAKEDAAMKKEDAAKATSSQTPVTGDAMTHEDTSSGQ